MCKDSWVFYWILANGSSANNGLRLRALRIIPLSRFQATSLNVWNPSGKTRYMPCVHIYHSGTGSSVPGTLYYSEVSRFIMAVSYVLPVCEHNFLSYQRHLVNDNPSPVMQFISTCYISKDSALFQLSVNRFRPVSNLTLASNQFQTKTSNRFADNGTWTGLDSQWQTGIGSMERCYMVAPAGRASRHQDFSKELSERWNDKK